MRSEKMDSMLQMQNEVIKLTEQLFITEKKSKEFEQEVDKTRKELLRAKQNGRQHDEANKRLVVTQDEEMREIQHKLLMFEASLRSEQKQIQESMEVKDALIDKQRKEIQMYRTLIISKARAEKMKQNRASMNVRTQLSSLKEVGAIPEEMSNGQRDVDENVENSQPNKCNKIFLNHRSVTRPKDIKNKRMNKERSKSIDSCDNSVQNPTVQYWVHPYV